MRTFLLSCAVLLLVRSAYSIEPSALATLSDKIERFGGNVEDAYKGFKVMVSPEGEKDRHIVQYLGIDFMGAWHLQSEDYRPADGERWRIEQWIYTFKADGTPTFCEHGVFFKGWGIHNYGQLFGNDVFNAPRVCTPQVLAKREDLIQFWRQYQPPAPAVPPKEEGPRTFQN